MIGKTHEKDENGFPNLIVGCMIDDQERLEFEEDLIRAKEKRRRRICLSLLS